MILRLKPILAGSDRWIDSENTFVSVLDSHEAISLLVSFIVVFKRAIDLEGGDNGTNS